MSEQNKSPPEQDALSRLIEQNIKGPEVVFAWAVREVGNKSRSGGAAANSTSQRPSEEYSFFDMNHWFSEDVIPKRYAAALLCAAVGIALGLTGLDRYRAKQDSAFVSQMENAEMGAPAQQLRITLDSSGTIDEDQIRAIVRQEIGAGSDQMKILPPGRTAVRPLPAKSSASVKNTP